MNSNSRASNRAAAALSPRRIAACRAFIEARMAALALGGRGLVLSARRAAAGLASVLVRLAAARIFEVRSEVLANLSPPMVKPRYRVLDAAERRRRGLDRVAI
jgi:hypothetical protein